MKTIEEKAKAYDETIEKLRDFYRDYDTVSFLIDVKEELANLFPELKESEDEQIRKHLLKHFQNKTKQEWNGMPVKNIIAWLEKQVAQKPIMIQWTGDNLKELVHFTGKSPKFEEWFKSWEDFENYVHTHNNIFKIFNEDGSHIEIPVGAWIVKTPDGYNIASRYVFKQKPFDYENTNIQQKDFAPKVEPKFKVGDFIINDYCAGKVVELTDYAYLLDTEQGIPFSCEHNARLWTIEDAKDGDVLCCESGWTCIFKALNSDISFSSYCFMDNTGWFCETGSESHTLEKAFIKTYNGNIYPATKKQRDTFFAKMYKAGYTFDFDNKELKKLSHQEETKVSDQETSEWSEEDERLLSKLQTYVDMESFDRERNGDDLLAWLKSLRPQKQWKPSDEQMRHLASAIEESNGNSVLQELYDHLKKLKEG